MSITDSWDAEYRAGRYVGAPPVPFVADIVAAARAHNRFTGVYIGCGNGRNLVPLLDAGLDLIGLDISPVAIGQLEGRAPRLIVGDLSALPAGERYGLVIAIQVFQHGTRAQAHAHLRAAAALVEPGGLLCIRVNDTDTVPEFDHDRFEEDDGSFTIRYRTGPQAELDLHFFTAAELRSLVGWPEVLPLRLDRAERTPPARGHRSHWDAIFQRPGADEP